MTVTGGCGPRGVVPVDRRKLIWGGDDMTKFLIKERRSEFYTITNSIWVIELSADKTLG